jgi:hypothetical protein
MTRPRRELVSIDATPYRFSLCTPHLSLQN